MIRFLADANFNRSIVDGLFRRMPGADLITAQELGLDQLPDPTLLEWCAAEGRTLLTQDLALPGYAYDKVAADQPMAGVVVVPAQVPLRQAIDDLELLARCTSSEEWQGRVVYLPLRI